MTDLSLVSMDDIWDELKKRNEAVVLIDMKTLDKDRESSQVSYKGGQFTCLGLVEKAKLVLTKSIMDNSNLGGEA